MENTIEEFGKLKYHCAKCANEFTIDDAIVKRGYMGPDVDKKLASEHYVQKNTTLIHFLCPSCNTIVNSLNMVN